MKMDEFKLMLYDMYKVDAQLPPLLGKHIDKFKQVSYSQWAVDELISFIANRIYPCTDGSIDQYILLTHEFKAQMEKYSEVNPSTKPIFQTAASLASDILDILHAMR